MNGSLGDLLGPLVHGPGGGFDVGHQLRHVVGELIHPTAHRLEEACLAGQRNALLEIPREHAPQDLLQLRFDGHLLGAVGPFEHGPDALSRLRDDRARHQAQGVMAQSHLLHMFSLQRLQGAARFGGIPVQHVDRGADQSRARELRQGLAQVVFELAHERFEHMIDIDDLEVGVGDQHRRGGVIQSRPDAAADGRGGVGFLFLQAAQLRLHLLQRQQHLAGLIAPGQLDPVVVAAGGDGLEDRHGVGHRIDDCARDQRTQCEAEQDDDGKGDAVPGGNTQLGVDPLGERLHDPGVHDHGEVGKGAGNCLSLPEHVLTLGGQALRVEHLRAHRLVVDVECALGLIESGDGTGANLHRIIGHRGKLGADRLQSHRRRVKMLQDRLTVSGADVAGQGRARRAQAHGSRIVHHRWQGVRGGRDQEARSSLRVVRQARLHPHEKIELENAVDQRVMLGQAVGGDALRGRPQVRPG